MKNNGLATHHQQGSRSLTTSQRLSGDSCQQLLEAEATMTCATLAIGDFPHQGSSLNQHPACQTKRGIVNFLLHQGSRLLLTRA